MLVTLSEILKDANERHYAVGAFNCLSLENVMGALEAAEDLRSPIILQLAEVQFPEAPMELMAPLYLEAAKRSSVPVCVHLDHGQSLETCVRAIRLGFTSVMFGNLTVAPQALSKRPSRVGYVLSLRMSVVSAVSAAESVNDTLQASSVSRMRRVGFGAPKTTVPLLPEHRIQAVSESDETSLRNSSCPRDGMIGRYLASVEVKWTATSTTLVPQEACEKAKFQFFPSFQDWGSRSSAPASPVMCQPQLS